MYFDTHCHLDCLDIDLLPVLRESELLGCISIGLRFDTFEKMYEQTKGISNIWYTVGNHPSEEFQQEPESSLIRDFAKLADVVAIGETGLDYYYDNVNKNTQKLRFERQIELALEVDKPIVIHCRDALDDLLEILIYHKVENFIMHCFTGNTDDAKRCLDLGGYISYSGIVTFKNAKEIQEAAKYTPLERLLIETDSPYLAPVPFRGKPNHPGMVKYVAAKIAELKGLELEKIQTITTENACKCFNIALAEQAFI